MKAHRYREAMGQFNDAFTRYARLAATDTGNAETRIFVARSSTQAGEACHAQARQARSEAAPSGIDGDVVRLR